MKPPLFITVGLILFGWVARALIGLHRWISEARARRGRPKWLPPIPEREEQS